MFSGYEVLIAKFRAVAAPRRRLGVMPGGIRRSLDKCLLILREHAVVKGEHSNGNSGPVHWIGKGGSCASVRG